MHSDDSSIRHWNYVRKYFKNVYRFWNKWVFFDIKKKRISLYYNDCRYIIYTLNFVKRFKSFFDSAAAVVYHWSLLSRNNNNNNNNPLACGQGDRKNEQMQHPVAAKYKIRDSYTSAGRAHPKQFAFFFFFVCIV